MAFTVHLVIHCLQALIMKKYIPAVVTSIICLPICIYIIRNSINLFSVDTVLWYFVFGFIIMVVNLFILHRGMAIFDKWLALYEQPK
jgi:hypothetical protein